MGNIKIESLPQIDLNNREYAFSDLHLDLKLDYTDRSSVGAKAEKRDVKMDFDLAAIKNSIVNILTTSPGEKILNPPFGLDLRDYLFDPISDTTADLIKARIKEGLRDQEPRIVFNQEPEVTPDEENNQYTIEFNIGVPFLEISKFLFVGLLKFDGFVLLNTQ